MDSMMQQQKELRAQMIELSDLVKNIDSRYASLEHEILAQKFRVLNGHHKKLQEKMVVTEQELSMMRQAKIKAEESLRNVQEMAFQFQDDQKWAPESHGEISRELDRIYSGARMWCKNHADEELFHERLQVDNWPAEWKTWTRYDETAFSTNAKVLPQLLLEAMLMHIICEKILTNPLFFLPWRMNPLGGGEDQDVNEASTALRKELSTSMVNVLEELIAGDMEGGHAWRSQWLRLLDPKPRGDESEMQRLNDTKIRTAEARKEAAQETMNVFVRSTAHHLICYRSLQPETEASLREIFINAAELSYKLWQRKSYLEFRGMKDLPRTFNNGVDILQPHRMHNVALGDDATALDGATVLMVTHPAVLVHGASDGSDYGRSGILKAAVVWVG